MTEKIDIRPATTDDLDATNHVIRNAVMNWQLPERVKRLSLSSYLYDETDLQHLRIVIAAIDDSIIGVLALDNDHADNNLLIHGLFVDPEQQHEGIGTRLFIEAEHIAKQQSFNGLLVKAHKDAIGFFSAMGMTKLAVADEGHDYAGRYWKNIR